MVSEKPPRHSKATKEPVTIDLTAEEAEVVAEPVRSNDTDEPEVGAADAERQATGEAVEASIAAETPDAPETAAVSEEPAASGPVEETPAEAELDARPQEPSFTDRTPEPEPVLPPPAPPRQKPATSTLVASGIFGGIVALALAGSMQYAGYLPGATAPAPADTSALSSQIEALRQEVQSLRNAQPSGDYAALTGRIETLEQAAANAAGNDLTQRLATIESELGSIRSSAEEGIAASADLARRLDEAEAKLNEPGAEEAAARAVAAASLKAAIDRGGPFATELETFARIATDDPAVAELQKFSESGVPSRAELLGGFPRVADTILQSVDQPDPNEGITTRLLNSAFSVVKIRRVGEVEGDTPEAIVARIEEGLRNGNLEAAASEWNKLPEAGKAASPEFKQGLDARIRVENLVGDTLTRAVNRAGTEG